MSQVLHVADCPETLDEARDIIRDLVEQRDYRLNLELKAENKNLRDAVEALIPLAERTARSLRAIGSENAAASHCAVLEAKALLRLLPER